MKTDIISATLKGNDAVKTRSLRKTPGAAGTYIGAIEPGTIFSGVKKYTAEKNGDFGVDSLTGDVWWECTGVKIKEDGTTKRYSGFVAERHAGKVLLTVTVAGDLPPPPPSGTGEIVGAIWTPIVRDQATGQEKLGDPIRFIVEG